MKRFQVYTCILVVFIGLILSGCSKNVQPTSQIEFKSVEQVGTIPTNLKNAIKNNAFKDVTAFENCVLKSEILTENKKDKTYTQQVTMMDIYGKELAKYVCNSYDCYRITTLIATDDGGFLFVLGFEDYAYDENTWASDNGFASRVIKCDRYGNLQFDTPFDHITGSALKYCFEKNEKFYLFGEVESPETKARGVHSPTDIYMVALDNTGQILKTKNIAGSDYDSINTVEMSDNDFVLSLDSQSDDGDFTKSNSNGYPVDWVFYINDELEITQKKRESGRDCFDDKIGEKDGVAVYNSDSFIHNLDIKSPNVFIDYDDFFLIISENPTGIYENTPQTISAIWYYTETVYSAYNYNGELLFRTSVDSSPDFDAWVFAMQP